MKRYLVALLCALTALTANAQFVDLGESMFYVRVGFEDFWFFESSVCGHYLCPI